MEIWIFCCIFTPQGCVLIYIERDTPPPPALLYYYYIVSNILDSRMWITFWEKAWKFGVLYLSLLCKIKKYEKRN